MSTQPKAFDKPTGLHIKSIGVFETDFGSPNKQALRSVLFPSGMFSGIPAGFDTLTSDLVAGPVANHTGTAPFGQDLSVMASCRFKYTKCNDGHITAYQGGMDFLSMVTYPAGYNHAATEVGTSYKSKGYPTGSSSGDAVVVDGMMLAVTEQSAGSIYGYYHDTVNGDGNRRNAFSISFTPNFQSSPTITVTDSYTGSTVESQPCFPDTSGSLGEPNPPAGIVCAPLTARIDPNDLTVSVLCASANSTDQDKETYYGLIDVVIGIRVYKQSVVNGDGSVTVKRHLGVISSVNRDPLDEEDDYDYRNDITSTQYTENYNYPSRVASLKSSLSGVAFNLFPSETFAIKTTFNSNLVCAGRTRDLVLRRRIIKAYNMDDPPVLVDIETGWVAASGPAPEEGSGWTDPTIFDVTTAFAATSTAPYTGTASVTYEAVGSRKVGYAFIEGHRQFLTVKGVTGSDSVTYSATVSLNRPKIYTALADANIQWGEHQYTNYATTAYRTEEPYIDLVATFSNFLANQPDETWDVASTSGNMLTALHYDDGAYLECVDGSNTVYGGSFTYKYLATGFSFADGFDSGDSTYFTLPLASTVSYTLTGADKRQAFIPVDTQLACAYLRADDKVASAYSQYPGDYWGGVSVPSEDVEVVKTGGSYIPDLVGQWCTHPNYTTLTNTSIYANQGSFSYASVSFMEYTGSNLTKTAMLIDSTYTDGTDPYGEVFRLEVPDGFVKEPEATDEEVGQYDDSWTTLAIAYNNMLTVAALLVGVPVPGVYYIAGQGFDGSGPGAPTGLRQYNEFTEVWNVVYLAVGTAPFSPIPSTAGSRAFVKDESFGFPYRGATFLYTGTTPVWVEVSVPKFVTPSYTEAELAGSEELGGFVGNSVLLNSVDAIAPRFQNNSTMYRIPVPGTTDKFLYTASCYRQNNLPSSVNLTRTYVGDSGGNVLQEITSMPGVNGDIDVTSLGLNSANKELSLGYVE